MPASRNPWYPCPAYPSIGHRADRPLIWALCRAGPARIEQKNSWLSIDTVDETLFVRKAVAQRCTGWRSIPRYRAFFRHHADEGTACVDDIGAMLLCAVLDHQKLDLPACSTRLKPDL